MTIILLQGNKTVTFGLNVGEGGKPMDFLTLLDWGNETSHQLAKIASKNIKEH